jgi:preprotein translocase subunit YajC
LSFVVFAQETTGGGATSSLIFLALMVGVFYFLIIRPQRRRAKAQDALATSLEVGQEVRTIGGIHGKIISMDEESVVLGVEEGKVRVARRAIAARVGDQA